MSLKISNSLRLPGEIEENRKRFFVPGNFIDDDHEDDSLDVEKMRKYAIDNTSGVRLPETECIAGGRIVTTFSRFIKMVEDGDNVVLANVIGPDMIDVEFQKPRLDAKRVGGR